MRNRLMVFDAMFRVHLEVSIYGLELMSIVFVCVWVCTMQNNVSSFGRFRNKEISTISKLSEPTNSNEIKPTTQPNQTDEINEWVSKQVSQPTSQPAREHKPKFSKSHPCFLVILSIKRNFVLFHLVSYIDWELVGRCSYMVGYTIRRISSYRFIRRSCIVNGATEGNTYSTCTIP